MDNARPVRCAKHPSRSVQQLAIQLIYIRASEFPAFASSGIKGSLHTQFAALCYRKNKGKTEVLLISSRDTGRWIIPKGWPIEGFSPEQVAETEAWEEAGVTGKLKPGLAGIFTYDKRLGGKDVAPCAVAVFPLKVKSIMADYPERHQRQRKWFTAKKAAALVSEPELARIIRAFGRARR